MQPENGTAPLDPNAYADERACIHVHALTEASRLWGLLENATLSLRRTHGHD